MGKVARRQFAALAAGVALARGARAEKQPLLIGVLNDQSGPTAALSGGGAIRDLGVYRVKSPTQSRGEWDLYAPLFTIPGAEAFSPPDPSCKLLEVAR